MRTYFIFDFKLDNMRESFQVFLITPRRAFAILIVFVSFYTNLSATNPTPAAVAVPAGQNWYILSPILTYWQHLMALL